MVCELCKNSIPINFKHGGKSYSFFDRDLEPPYAEFESITENNGKRTFSRYLINVGKHR